MSGQERRRHKRIRCSFTVRVRPFKEGVPMGTSGNWETVSLEDLSISGMLFHHTHSFAPGTMLEFNIMPSAHAAPVYCIGRVIRSVKRLGGTPVPDQTQLYMTAVLLKSFDGGTLESIKRIWEAAERFTPKD